MTSQKKDKLDVLLGPEKELPGLPEQPRFTDELPGMSFTMYITYHLLQSDARAIKD